MSEMKRPSFEGRKENTSSPDPYADIPGVPYPEWFLSPEDATQWLEGKKKIFERMKQQEKQIVAELKETLEHAKTQEEFDALIAPLKAAAAKLGGQTVAVRNITVVAPSGVSYVIAVVFKPRRDIAQKDEKPEFGIMVM